MEIFNIKDIKAVEIIPGFIGRLVHTHELTIAYREIDKGSILPLHHHVHTQTTQVTQGELELTISDITRIFRPGELVVIPSNTPHSGKALLYCTAIDTFTQVREDYKKLSDPIKEPS